MPPRDAHLPATAREHAATVLRFLVGGGLNTLATLLVYWLLLRVLHPQWAYAASYAAGIGLGYLIHTGFVFRTRRGWRTLLPFPLVHAAGYLVGAAVLALATGPLGIDPRTAPLLAIAASLPLTFLLTRRLLRGRR